MGDGFSRGLLPWMGSHASFHVGFTGTRVGMTDAQRDKVYDALVFVGRLKGPGVTVHHGDCIGADTNFHRLVKTYFDLWRIEIHPGHYANDPEREDTRSFNVGDFVHESFPHMERNKHIVTASQLVLATPATAFDPGKGGTWHTIRFARKQGVHVMAWGPDGKEINFATDPVNRGPT